MSKKIKYKLIYFVPFILLVCPTIAIYFYFENKEPSLFITLSLISYGISMAGLHFLYKWAKKYIDDDVYEKSKYKIAIKSALAGMLTCIFCFFNCYI